MPVTLPIHTPVHGIFIMLKWSSLREEKIMGKYITFSQIKTTMKIQISTQAPQTYMILIIFF